MNECNKFGRSTRLNGEVKEEKVGKDDSLTVDEGQAVR